MCSNMRYAMVFILLFSFTGGLHADNYTFTISTPKYSIHTESDLHVIEMKDYGSSGEPGTPQLPAKTYLIALPPAAVVTAVDILGNNRTDLPQSYSIKPNNCTIPGNEEDQSQFELSMLNAQQEFERNYNTIYSRDDIFPEKIGAFIGQGQWRRYTYIRVRVHPFQYQPLSGRLIHYGSFSISIDYELPTVDSPEMQKIQNLLTDDVLDDIISQHIINFDDAKQWYPVTTTAVELSQIYDYVIIVENENIKQAVDKLKTWKEQLGHGVKVVTLDTVYTNYNGQDDAEKIWNFLQKKYSNEGWSIRYVLLAGNVDRIPTRFLFPSDKEWAYATDYYYAKLTVNWDVDNDGRWGEFSDDNFDTTPDVIVGRIPFNDQTTIERICDNIIAFEKDSGSWKQMALMAMGIMDFNSSGKTDGGDLGEYLKTNILNPYGWNSFTLYEKGGLDTSKYKSDYPLLEEAFLASCAPQTQGIINLVAHGNSGGMSGHVWKKDLDKDGVCDYSKDKNVNEFVYNTFSSIGHIGADFASAVVFLCGCSTAPPCNYKSADITSSLHPTTQTMDNVTRRYLHTGAPAAIGSSAGSNYGQNWSKPQDGGGQSLNYYFNDFLITRDQKVGEAFYNAQMTFANNHSLQRGIRVFNYYGDPALNLKGYDDHPGGADVVIHDGWYQHFAADNADGGDMYVAVITTTLNQAGEVKIYKSTDHGESWELWNTLSRRNGIYDVDLIVGEWGSGEFIDENVLVFIASVDGTVQVYRYPINGGAVQTVTIASEGGSISFWGLNAGRNPDPRTYTLYLTYSILNPSSQTSQTKVCRSSNNGISWDGFYSYDGFYFSSVDGGVNSQAYLVAKKFDNTENVYFRRSADGGATWGTWLNLTQNDNAYDHGVSEPVVASSTDPGAPTVWVAYPYYKTGDRNKGDIRVAYSLNGGVNWTTDQILAEDNANEFGFHLKSYNAGVSRWMNCAYIYNPSQPQIIWRCSSGTVAGKWSPMRMVNDNTPQNESDMQPRIVYSPGAPSTGSGVVYAGVDKLYFSAPWLSNNNSQNVALFDVKIDGGEQPEIVLSLAGADYIDIRIQNGSGKTVWTRSAEFGQGTHVFSWNGCNQMLPSGIYLCNVRTSFGQKSVQFSFQNKNEQLPGAATIDMDWTETGELEQAFLISSIVPVNDDIMYAATAVHQDPDRNAGRIFKSVDGGENWEPTAPLDDSWSASALMVVEENLLLAGGIALFEDQAHGVIYRSDDGGQSWYFVFEFPEGVVTDFIRTHDDHILAATGWNGMIARSANNGETWEPFAILGENVQINALFQASNGALFAGVEIPDNIGMIMRSEIGEEWHPIEGLEGISAIYDIIELDGKLLAAARGHDMGWVLQSDLDGVNWFKTTEFPDTEIQAVHCLMADEEGKLYAGLEIRQGPSFSRVFYRNPNEEQWLEFGSKIDLATTVFSLARTNRAILAGTGAIYGNLYKYSFFDIDVENDDTNAIPREFALLQNYPNPFNPHTLIKYQIAEISQPVLTKISIYDIRGREVINLVNEVKQPGEYNVVWNGKNLEGNPVSNGIYICTMKAGTFVQHRRLVLLK